MRGGACFVQAVGVIEMGSVTDSSERLGSRRQSSSLFEHSFLGESGGTLHSSAIALDMGALS